MDRCEWTGTDPFMIQYHDKEWGVPLHDDQKLFEFLCLEGAQAGLSWRTILHKRENYRMLFDQFDARKIAGYDEVKIDSLLQDRRIVRNRLKVRAFISNAKAFLKVREEHGSFDSFIWAIAPDTTNRFKSLSDVPAQTERSRRMSRILKKEGFKFVGPTICYAFMQATGMVNDHITSCFRYDEISALSRA